MKLGIAKTAAHFVASFIASHWRGEVKLARAFWIHFLLLWFTVNFLERFLFPPFLHGEARVTAAAISYFVVARLIIYPWQIVGVIRACERRIKTRGERAWAFAAEGAVVLSLLATFAIVFSGDQNLLAYRGDLRAAEVAAAKNANEYSLELIDGGKLLHLRGAFQAGITVRVQTFLDAHPQVRGIVLDSGGGQIYEGRGLARLIRERKLATYSLRECASSCATAFIAGTKRALGAGAKLGFHQYKYHAVLPVVDVAEEQARDRALFRAQGVSADFLRKIFLRPPEQMWWPSHAELIAAGVVHQVDALINLR